MSGRLRVLFEEPEFTLATFENALLWSLRGEPNLARIEWAGFAHAKLAEEYPNGFAVLTILSQEASLSVSKEALERRAHIVRQYRGSYCGFCHVVEGSAFRASIARSVLAGVPAEPGCPARAFSDLERGARWLGALMSPGAGAERMGIDLATAAHRARSPLRRP